MTLIEGIRAKVAASDFEFSRHAVDQTLRRRISVQEIREAVVSGQVIEDYPGDKYGPSCLLLGETQSGRPLHVQCSYPARPLVKIVTVYEPDPAQWVNFAVRK
jgi:hypothetical protein